MKRYLVRVSETLERLVEVDAEDWSDAREKVKQKYYDEEIVLDSSDYVDTDIEAIWEE